MAALISPAKVEDLFGKCLGEEGLGDSVLVEGIAHSAYISKELLEPHRQEVEEMLANLPYSFRQSAGGGWSFLNMCQDRHDEQWTGSHATMEHLFMMGVALDLANFAAPRDMWCALPGGMPYITVKM